MTMIDFGTRLADIPDPIVMPADEDYKLRVIEAKEGTGKESGKPYIMVTFEITGEDNAKDFNNVFMLPTPEDSEKTRLSKMRRFRDFFKAFDFDGDRPWSPEELVGCEGWAILGVREEEYNGQTEERNYIRKFSVGA